MSQYVFGLFSNIATNKAPGIFNLLGVPLNYTITAFAVTGNQVMASFTFYQLFDAGITLPVEVIIFFQYNDEGEITQVLHLIITHRLIQSTMQLFAGLNGSSML
jgi:hypothetical protein